MSVTHFSSHRLAKGENSGTRTMNRKEFWILCWRRSWLLLGGSLGKGDFIWKCILWLKMEKIRMQSQQGTDCSEVKLCQCGYVRTLCSSCHKRICAGSRRPTEAAATLFLPSESAQELLTLFCWLTLLAWDSCQVCGFSDTQNL